MSLFSVLGLKLSLMDARDKSAQLSSKFGTAQPVEVGIGPGLWKLCRAEGLGLNILGGALRSFVFVLKSLGCASEVFVSCSGCGVNVLRSWFEVLKFSMSNARVFSGLQA